MDKGLLKSEVLVKMVLEEDIETKEEYSELLLNYLSDSILTNTTEEFDNNIRNLNYKMEAMSEALDIYSNKNAANSYFFGIIKALVEISGKLNSEKSFVNDIKKIEKTEYGIKVLQSLYEMKTLNHGTLAKKMNMSSHSLTNFMKRMEETNLWSKSKYGKYINYDITPIGEKCYQYMIMTDCKKIESNSHNAYIENITKIIEVVIDEVTSIDPNINKIAHEVVKNDNELTERDERVFRLNVSKSIRRRNNRFNRIIECPSNDLHLELSYTENIIFEESNIKHDINSVLSRKESYREKIDSNHFLELIGR